jgi:cytochrome c oxidase subunit II
MGGGWMKTIATLLIILTAVTVSPRPHAQEPAKTIEVHVRRFAFSPTEITLKKGETVDLKLVSEDVTHSLVVNELEINQEVSKGHPADIMITPQMTGDFHGQCGHFCGNGHGTMTFTIHVTD